MKNIDLEDFCSNSYKYLQSAMSGDDIFITNKNDILFHIIPFKALDKDSNKKTKKVKKITERSYGLAEGKVWISDDFDKEDDEILEMFGLK